MHIRPGYITLYSTHTITTSYIDKYKVPNGPCSHSSMVTIDVLKVDYWSSIMLWMDSVYAAVHCEFFSECCKKKLSLLPGSVIFSTYTCTCSYMHEKQEQRAILKSCECGLGTRLVQFECNLKVLEFTIIWLFFLKVDEEIFHKVGSWQNTQTQVSINHPPWAISNSSIFVHVHVL